MGDVWMEVGRGREWVVTGGEGASHVLAVGDWSRGTYVEYSRTRSDALDRWA